MDTTFTPIINDRLTAIAKHPRSDGATVRDMTGIIIANNLNPYQYCDLIEFQFKIADAIEPFKKAYFDRLGMNDERTANKYVARGMALALAGELPRLSLAAARDILESTAEEFATFFAGFLKIEGKTDEQAEVTADAAADEPPVETAVTAE